MLIVVAGADISALDLAVPQPRKRGFQSCVFISTELCHFIPTRRCSFAEEDMLLHTASNRVQSSLS